MKSIRVRSASAVLMLLALCVAASAAERDAAASLIATLQQGGSYIVMRHASSPRDPPAAADVAPGNIGPERQLDREGRETARAMGEALRRLRIPVGQVLSSPTWRAQETVKEAAFGTPRLVPELGDGGRSMSATTGSQAEWLTRQVSLPVDRGNTVLITHYPNLRAAFPEHAADLRDGEALILRPDPGKGVRFLGRIRIEEWATLGR